MDIEKEFPVFRRDGHRADDLEFILDRELRFYFKNYKTYEIDHPITGYTVGFTVYENGNRYQWSGCFRMIGSDVEEVKKLFREQIKYILTKLSNQKKKP